MGCWEFYQILLFTWVMAVILVQCHYAHQLYILNWMLNLYFYDSIITEKDKWLKHFLWFYTWFQFNYLNTSPNSPSLKFHSGLLSNQPQHNHFLHFHSGLSHHYHCIINTLSIIVAMIIYIIYCLHNNFSFQSAFI